MPTSLVSAKSAPHPQQLCGRPDPLLTRNRDRPCLQLPSQPCTPVIHDRPREWSEAAEQDRRDAELALASAGLAALHAEHRGFSWHTLGCHFRDSEPFWTTVGADVPGGYHQRELCPHLEAHG
jgi:hypothetical protein